jgi:UDP-N-acetylglucosamine:LPS N-acetylglucosamine transferase
LTKFESLACRVPIIADLITEPMPQEAGTANMIAERGAGVMLRRSIDVVPVVRRMMEDEVHYSRMRAATVGLAIPNSTRQIVEEIAALIPQSEARYPQITPIPKIQSV